ncbi:RdgB/HAM1 family non-canonical purine NTP pyrophosphatase [Gilvimarinus sp. F26214L]|uniref:RdgB/HAM1 family non-canonical purine NTP pyrophosphatase n=1 Tax=Gilvimarinus sp. DZF01 TaxID=3461371 RepID=UPI00404524A4
MNSRPRIVIASNNSGKLKEFRELFSELPLDLLAQSDFQIGDAEETGLSFVENAIIKARHACHETGLPAIADDSGLAVDALRGAPGIYSARYSGEKDDAANNSKLLEQLKNVPETQRSARFHCALAYMRYPEDPCPIICQASWEGQILFEPRGTNGFGYDPLFYLPLSGCTSAELPPEQKNRMSHRGQALQKLLREMTA